MAMAYLQIRFDSEIDPNGLLRMLSEADIHVRITAADWFEHRKETSMRAIKQMDPNVANPEYVSHLLGSIDRARKESGPTRGISISIDGLVLDGRLSATLLRVYSKNPISQAVLPRIEAAFHGSNIIRESEVYNG